MGIVDVDVGSLADSIMGGLDSLFTSDEERMAYRDKIEARLHDRLTMQAKTNQEEAKTSFSICFRLASFYRLGLWCRYWVSICNATYYDLVYGC